jgi:hypothetical protein
MKIDQETLDALLRGEKPRELYRINFLGKVFADGDLSNPHLVEVSSHTFAKDAEEARAIFHEGFPHEQMTLLFIRSITPVPGVDENSMIARVNPEGLSLAEMPTGLAH